MSNKKANYWEYLVQELASDSKLAYLIRNAAHDDRAITSYLQFQLKQHGAPPDVLSKSGLYPDFLAFCGRNHSGISPQILAAIADCRKAKGDLTMAHKHLVLKLGLNWKSGRQQKVRDEHLGSFGVPATCKRLKTPYPPMSM